MRSFTSSRQVSPSGSGSYNICNKNSSTAALEQFYVLNTCKNTTKRSYLWGSINLILICIVWYDINMRCSFPFLYFLYLEYCLLSLFSINLLYHLICYLKLSTMPSHTTPCKPTTPNSFSNSPNISYRSTHYSPTSLFYSNCSSPNSSMDITPMNTTALSWRSNPSTPFNNDISSKNLNNSTTPKQILDISSTSHTPRRLGLSIHEEEPITSEHSLSEYLKQYNIYERNGVAANNTEQENNDGTMNTFWSYPTPASKSNDASNFLRKCQYQLSSKATDSSSSSPGGKSKSDALSSINQSLLGTEVWRRFRVDSHTLTQWNANIRLWLSKTIIERLIEQIDQVDDALQRHGFTDIRIGHVGLDRLKKTAQLPVVLQTIPTLWTLVSFFEVTSTQEYLIKRLRELSEGGCISAFKWNGGTSFNGKEWDDSLPSDSAIIMHLFATYMDTQLLPSPNEPDVKSFSGHHFIKMIETKTETKSNSNTIAIEECSIKPPHYRVLVGKEAFEIVKGYNNLFHTILLFLYHVNKYEAGMLGRTNLGKAGINILWVIDA